MLGSRELFIQLEKDYKKYEEGIKNVRDELSESKKKLETDFEQTLGQLLEALVRFKYESGEFLGESDGLPNELGESWLGELAKGLIPIVTQALKNYYEALKNYYKTKSILEKKHGLPKELCRICNQAKLISQIIAFIWRWVDEKDQGATIDYTGEANIKTTQGETAVVARSNEEATITIKPIESDQNKKDKKKFAQELKEIFDKPYKGETNPLMELLTTYPSFVQIPSEVKPNKTYQKYLDFVFEKNYKEHPRKNDIFPIFNDIEKNRYHIFVDCQRFHGELRDPTANAPTKMTISVPYPPRPPLGEATLTKKDLKKWIKNTNLEEIIAPNPYIPTTCC